MKKRWIFMLAVVIGALAQGAWAQRNEEFPRDLHGLWWQPSDPGWAIAMFDHQEAMSSALLVYDHVGKPTWFVAPRLACHRESPPWLNVDCDGPMYRVTGPWFGAPFRQDEVVVRQVGEWSGQFLTPLFGGVGPNVERFLFASFSVDGALTLGAGNKPMHIQRVDARGDFLWQDGRYSGLWGNPAESGWGIGVFVQNNALYATLFVHGPDREPRWYVVVANASGYEVRPDPLFEGEVFETRGSHWATVPRGSTEVRRVGRASLHFGAEPGDAASLQYSIDGVQVSKTIFRAP